MLKLSLTLVCVLFGVNILVLSNENLVFGQSYEIPTTIRPENQTVLTFVANTEGKQQPVLIPADQLLFNVLLHYDENNNFKSMTMTLKPGLDNFYHKVGFFGKPHDTVFIYPIFTQAAYYNGNDFYDYYNKNCGSECLTVDLPTRIKGGYSSSLGGAFVLTLLNYSHVTDMDVDKNPDILKQYKRVIVLHNEYVTKKEFDAITSHPDVVFLYPNALYAEVKTDYTSNTITLARGHGYPDQNIRNGFDWQSDNSKYEYNAQCNGWTFYRSQENYSMLNCYPEYSLLASSEMLILLQNPDPTQLLDDTSNWLRYQSPQTAHVMLADYDINGTFVPPWLVNPAIWVENGELHKFEFLGILNYLYKNNIIR